MGSEWQHTSVSDVDQEDMKLKLNLPSGEDEPKPVIEQKSPGSRRSKFQAAPPEDVFYTENSDPPRQGKISVPSKTKIAASPEKKKLSRDRSQENWTASLEEDSSASDIDTKSRLNKNAKSRLTVPDEIGLAPHEKIQDNFEMTKSMEPVSVVSEVQYDMEQQFVSSKRTPVFMRKIQSDDRTQHSEVENSEISQETDESYSVHSKLTEYTLESTDMDTTLGMKFEPNGMDSHDSRETEIISGNINDNTVLQNQEDECNKKINNSELSSDKDSPDLMDSPTDHNHDHGSVNQDSDTSEDTSLIEYSTSDMSVDKPGCDTNALKPAQWKPNQSYVQAVGRQESLESQNSHNTSKSISSVDTLTESPLTGKESMSDKWQNNHSYHRAVTDCDSPQVQKTPQTQLEIKSGDMSEYDSPWEQKVPKTQLALKSEDIISLSPDEGSLAKNTDMGCSSSREPSLVMQEKKKRDVGDFFPGAALRHRLRSVQKEVFNDSFYSDASQESILDIAPSSPMGDQSEFTSNTKPSNKSENSPRIPNETAKEIDEYSGTLTEIGANSEQMKERIPEAEVKDLAKTSEMYLESEHVINPEPVKIQTTRIITDQCGHHMERCNNQKETDVYDNSESGTIVKHQVPQVNSIREQIKAKDYSFQSETELLSSDIHSNSALSDSDVENQYSYSSDSSGVCRISIGMGNNQSTSHKPKSPNAKADAKAGKINSKGDPKIKGSDRELDCEVSMLTENVLENNNEITQTSQHKPTEPQEVSNAADNKSKPAHLFKSYKRNSPDQFLGVESPEGGATSGKKDAGSKDNFVSVVMCGEEGEEEMEPTQMMEKCINNFTGRPIVPQQVVLNQRQTHNQRKQVQEDHIALEEDTTVSSSRVTAIDEIMDKSTRYDSVNFYSDDDGDEIAIGKYNKPNVPITDSHNAAKLGHSQYQSYHNNPTKDIPSSPLPPPSEYRSDDNVPNDDITNKDVLHNGSAIPEEIHSPPLGKKPVPPPRKSSVKAKFLASIGRQKQSLSSDEPPEAVIKAKLDHNIEKNKKNYDDPKTAQANKSDKLHRNNKTMSNGYSVDSKTDGNILGNQNEVECLVVDSSKSEVLASTPVFTNSPIGQSGLLNSSLPGRQNSNSSVLVEDDYVPDAGESLIRSHPSSTKSSPRGPPPASTMDKQSALPPSRDPVRDIMNLSAVPHVDASVLSQDIILDGSLSFLNSVGSGSGVLPVNPERPGRTLQPGIEDDDSVFTPGAGSAFTPRTAQDTGSRFSFLNQGLVASPSLHEQYDSSSPSEVGDQFLELAFKPALILVQRVFYT